VQLNEGGVVFPSATNFAAFTSLVGTDRIINASHNYPTLTGLSGYLYKGTNFYVSDNRGNILETSKELVVSTGNNLSYKFVLPSNLLSGAYTVFAQPIFQRATTNALSYGGALGVQVAFLSAVKIFGHEIRSSTDNLISGNSLNNQTNMKVTLFVNELSQNNVAKALVAIPHGSQTDSQILELTREPGSNRWSTTFNAQQGQNYSSVKPYFIVFGVTGAGFAVSEFC
jgi:hypothetical protein